VREAGLPPVEDEAPGARVGPDLRADGAAGRLGVLHPPSELGGRHLHFVGVSPVAVFDDGRDWRARRSLPSASRARASCGLSNIGSSRSCGCDIGSVVSRSSGCIGGVCDMVRRRSSCIGYSLVIFAPLLWHSSQRLYPAVLLRNRRQRLTLRNLVFQAIPVLARSELRLTSREEAAAPLLQAPGTSSGARSGTGVPPPGQARDPGGAAERD
jgi:hypothetical protein